MLATPGDCGRIRRTRAWALPLVLSLAFLIPGGCVRRRMMIRSNPPGATVYVDDYEIGKTPVAHHFNYYGTRKIRLVKDGFETRVVMQRIRAPWYEIPPLDLASENLVPGELRDTRTLCYQLTPQTLVPPERLISRAESLRRGVHTATGTAPPLPPQPIPVHPAPQGPVLAPPAAGQPPVQLPHGIGGQPVHPLPPSSGSGGLSPGP
jgi:hypothetical protein